MLVVDEVKELVAESVPPSVAFGLRWKFVGTSRPKGKQLQEPGHHDVSWALRKKLAEKVGQAAGLGKLVERLAATKQEGSVEFTMDEWKRFEVRELRSDSFVESERTYWKPDPWAGSEEKKKLEDVLAWLLLNSMRSEDLQHMQLVQQCLHNVWRRRAFARLLDSEAPTSAGVSGRVIHGESIEEEKPAPAPSAPPVDGAGEQTGG